MKRQPAEPPPPVPTANPTQCRHWWEQVATWFAQVEAEAEYYIHERAEKDGVLDEAGISEVLESLRSARASADCMFGAYYRHTKTLQQLPQPQAQQTAAPQQQPTYG